MSRRIESLLQDAGRARELLIGWACALVSGAFTSLLGWLLYLVAWRNPRQYDAHDLQKGGTLAILGVVLAVAVGFGVIAFRLIRHRRTGAGLMSPISLRIGGSFFALASVLVLIDAIVTKRWLHVLHLWTVTTGAASMALAAFALARRRERANASRSSNSQIAAPDRGGIRGSRGALLPKPPRQVSLGVSHH